MQRRRIPPWAVLHAWKLAGLTALVTFTGVFIAVSLSLLLRPTRSYFFPLLSDVGKHQPEGSILHIAFAVSTALLFATTTASLQHCHALRLFSHQPHHLIHSLEQSNISDDALPDVAINQNHSKRGPPRVSTRQLIVIVLFFVAFTSVVFHFLATGSLSDFVFHRYQLLHIGLYSICAVWVFAMCFLVWYFLKLQQIPDIVHPELPLLLGEDTQSNTSSGDAAARQNQNRFIQRIKGWASRLIVILRPVCVTGQLASLIKIAGLWLALDSFSISKIKLVKIALLAALAFAEYTAAFFFAFFMAILAIDMRSKAYPPNLQLYG